MDRPVRGGGRVLGALAPGLRADCGATPERRGVGAAAPRRRAGLLRYTHVHGRHIDEAIKAIGRSVPEHPRNPRTKIRAKTRTVGEQTE